MKLVRSLMRNPRREELGISWRRAVIPSTDDWTIVVNLQGFLKTFREHAEALYLKELESRLSQIDLQTRSDAHILRITIHQDGRLMSDY